MPLLRPCVVKQHLTLSFISLSSPYPCLLYVLVFSMSLSSLCPYLLYILVCFISLSSLYPCLLYVLDFSMSLSSLYPCFLHILVFAMSVLVFHVFLSSICLCLLYVLVVSVLVFPVPLFSLYPCLYVFVFSVLVLSVSLSSPYPCLFHMLVFFMFLSFHTLVFLRSISVSSPYPCLLYVLVLSLFVFSMSLSPPYPCILNIHIPYFLHTLVFFMSLSCLSRSSRCPCLLYDCYLVSLHWTCSRTVGLWSFHAVCTSPYNHQLTHSHLSLLVYSSVISIFAQALSIITDSRSWFSCIYSLSIFVTISLHSSAWSEVIPYTKSDAYHCFIDRYTNIWCHINFNFQPQCTSLELYEATIIYSNERRETVWNSSVNECNELTLWFLCVLISWTVTTSISSVFHLTSIITMAFRTST